MEHERSDINSALAEIEIARARLTASGAVDDEDNRLNSIVKDLRDGSITPETAITLVHSLLESRSEYH